MAAPFLPSRCCLSLSIVCRLLHSVGIHIHIHIHVHASSRQANHNHPASKQSLRSKNKAICCCCQHTIEKEHIHSPFTTGCPLALHQPSTLIDSANSIFSSTNNPSHKPSPTITHHHPPPSAAVRRHPTLLSLLSLTSLPPRSPRYPRCCSASSLSIHGIRCSHPHLIYRKIHFIYHVHQCTQTPTLHSLTH